MRTAAARRDDVLVLVLTAAAAGVDALSYLGLGHVFPANMTGNTVLLGIGLATGDPAATARSATALGAYVLAAATVPAILPGRGRYRRLLAPLLVEVALLVGLVGWWLLLPAYPAGGFRYGLIALAGAAMGVQSCTVGRLGVPGVATTYITGTWTALSTGLGARLDRRQRPGTDGSDLLRQAGVVGIYLASALAVTAGLRWWGPLTALVPVGLVVVAATIAPPRLSGNRSG